MLVFVISVILLWVDTTHSQLTDFNTTLVHIMAGNPTRFHVNLDLCTPQDEALRNTTLEKVAGIVDQFEYFYGERFGPVPFFGVSNSQIVLTEQGQKMRLTQIRVYEDQRVRMRVVSGDLNDTTSADTDVLWCDLYNGTSGNAKFVSPSSAEPLQLNTFDDITSSLIEGNDVRFTSHYYSCGPNPQETVGGGVISGWDLNQSEDVLEYHVGSMIVNYFAGDVGYLFNGATGYVYKDISGVTFRPWAIDFGTWNQRYVSLYNCDINDGTFEGGIYFYKV